jgi:hypothetical protein
MAGFEVSTEAARLDHPGPGTYVVRGDQAQAQELLGDNNPLVHVMKANFVWDLPDVKSDRAAVQALGMVLNDWGVSGIWTGSTGAAYTASFTYQSGGSAVNLTGSPDFAPRIRVVGDPGAGCSGDPLRQFNTAAFQGSLTGSTGLESGTDYLRGCFLSVFDVAIARTIRLGGGRSLQLRLDMYNAFNSAIVTNRNTQMQLTSPTDPVTAVNLPFDASGAVRPNFSQPKNAGFGVATVYQASDAAHRSPALPTQVEEPQMPV